MNKKLKELKEEEERLNERLALLGGPGSGNKGHAGRPGFVGGSKPDDDPSNDNPSSSANVNPKELRPLDEGYYKFKEKTTIYVKTGSKSTGAYSGSSKIYQATYEPRTASPGDELHMIPGGMFFRKKGSDVAEYAAFVPPDSNKSPFEKSYGPSMRDYAPVSRLDKFANRGNHPERNKFEYKTG